MHQVCAPVDAQQSGSGAVKVDRCRLNSTLAKFHISRSVMAGCWLSNTAVGGRPLLRIQLGLTESRAVKIGCFRLMVNIASETNRTQSDPSAGMHLAGSP